MLRRAVMVVCLSLWLASGVASAASLTWSISGGTFADGGTVSGTFEQNPVRPRPSTWNLSVAGGGFSFPPRSYSPSNSRVEKLLWPPNPQETYRFKATNEGTRELRLTPSIPLDGSATTVPLSFLNDQGSIECFNCAPSRLLTTGVVQLVSAAPTLILVSVAPDPTTVGATTTATVSIDAIAAFGPATGTVTILDSANAPVCTITLPATSCTFVPTTSGGQTLRARYNGDVNYGSTFSNARSFSVNPAAPTTVTFVSVTPTPTLVGVTTTATVVVDTIAALGPPTGTVTVIDSFSQEFCTITLPATSCTFAPTVPSTATVVAQYSGDASYASVTSNALPFIVGPVHVSASVSVTPNPTVVGGATTATGSSIPTFAPFPPATGTYTMLDGSLNVLCTITLPTTACAFAPASPGNLAVAALYSGDANYEGDLSSAKLLVVVGITSAAPPDGTVGSAYSHFYTSSALSLDYTVTSGALPPGVTLAHSGLLSGTPTAAGTFTGVVTGTRLSLSTSQAFSITIVAIPPPTIAKAFVPLGMPVNGTATLTFTLTNPNAGTALTGVGFTDPLPADLVVATPNGLANTCGGTVTAVAGTGSIGLVNGSLAAGGSCTMTVRVTGSTGGLRVNTTSAVTSTEGGTGGSAVAYLVVVDPSTVAPTTIAKAFGTASIVVNGTTTLTFTLTNPNPVAALSGVGFTDTLPAGLTVANGASATCGGTLTTSGGNTIELAGATIAASGTCLIPVTVTGTFAGAKNNTTGAVTSTQGGTGGTASATLTVVAPPTIAKAFGAASTVVNETTTLTFTLTNPNAATALTGVGFTDPLPAGLVVATPNGLTGACGGGTITATAGATSLGLAGATLAAGTPCQFAINVRAVTTGVQANTTSAVTSANGGSGKVATASITVTTVTAPNLTIAKSHAASFVMGQTGDYTITVSNIGQSPTAGAVTVTDTLPAGLTAASLSGEGWTCAVASVSCTRSDVLAAGASYPPITLIVSIAATAPDSLTNTATVSGGGDASPSDNTVTDPTSVVAAAAIPTLSTFAQAVFMMVVLLSSLLLLRRRPTTGR